MAADTPVSKDTLSTHMPSKEKVDPLTERLRFLRPNAKFKFAKDQYYMVGEVMHEAAHEIERLQTALQSSRDETARACQDYREVLAENTKLKRAAHEPPADAPQPHWSEALQDDIYYASDIDPYIDRLRAAQPPGAWRMVINDPPPVADKVVLVYTGEAYSAEYDYDVNAVDHFMWMDIPPLPSPVKCQCGACTRWMPDTVEIEDSLGRLHYVDKPCSPATKESDHG
jgi:hypothetical protein